MSVLIFIEHTEGQIKKASLEALTYGARIAELTGTTAEGLVLGTPTESLPELGKYGVKKIHQVENDILHQFYFLHTKSKSDRRATSYKPTDFQLIKTAITKAELSYGCSIFKFLYLRNTFYFFYGFNHFSELFQMHHPQCHNRLL